jgi:hypothetical protein
MYRNLLSVAALILAGGFFLQSLRVASAQPAGPTITGGEPPWVDFAGDVGGREFVDVYEVPADRALIVTGMNVEYGYVDLYQDAAMIADGSSGVMFSRFLGAGNARITVAPGTTLRVYNNDDSRALAYVIQGYLVHP